MKIASTVLAALLVSPSAAVLAAPIISAGDPVIGVQLQNGNTIAPSVEGTDYPAGEPPAASIDGNTGSKYLNFLKLNTGIVVDPSNDLLQVTGLELVTANDASERDPASFSIYGTNVSQSTNFADYTTIVTNVPILGTDPGRGFSSGLVTFTNPTSAAFDSYLVIFPTVRNADGSNSMQVAEIILDGTPVPEPGTVGLLGLGGLGLLARRRRH